MKKNFSSVFCFFMCSVFLTSCENFLDGGTFRERLQNDIDYAQSKPCDVRVECGSSEGQIMTETVAVKKVSDELNVEFRSSSGVYFLGWSSFTKLKDGSYMELSSEYVDFSNSVSDNNTHSVTVTFRKGADNIYIKPVCMQVSPLPVAGAYANMPVQITFSIPFTEESDDVFCYGNDNILITSGSSVLTDCFESPAVSSDRKTVSLVPVAEGISSLLENSLSVNISFTFGINAVLKSETLSYALSEKTFSVKYVPFKDTLKPVCTDLYARRAQTASEIIPAEEKNVFSNDDDVHLRRSGKIVYIYGNYFDDESGIKSVCIKEKLLNYKNGASVFNPELSNVHECKKSDSACVNFETDDAGNTEFCIAHEIKSEDGLVQLYVTVKDFCGNESDEKIITVIKNTSLSLDGVYPFNYCPYTDEQQEITNEREFDEDYFNRELKTVKILSDTVSPYYVSKFESHYDYYMKNTVFKNTEYSLTAKDPKSLSLYCIYNSKKEKMSYNEDDFYWYLTLDVESIEGLPIKIYAEDDTGNSCEADYAFAGSPVLSGVEVEENLYGGKSFKIHSFISNYSYTRMWELPVKNDKWFRNYANDAFSAGVWEENEYDYNTSFSVIMMNECLSGPFDRKVYCFDTDFTGNSDDIPVPEIESAVWGEIYLNESGGNKLYCYPLIIKIREQDLNYGYDAVKVRVQDGVKFLSEGAFSKGSDTISLKSSDFNYSRIKSHNMTLELFGVKGNKSSKSYMCVLSRTELEDVISPNIKFKRNDYNLCYELCSTVYPDYLENFFSYHDYESGIKSVYYLLNGIKYTKDIVDTSNFDAIPFWDMSDGENSITVYAEDNSNNRSSVNHSVNIFTPPQFRVTAGSTLVELTSTSSEKQWVHFWVFIYKYDTSSGTWSLYNNLWSDDEAKNNHFSGVIKEFTEVVNSEEDTFINKCNEVMLPANSFVKIITLARDTERTEVNHSYYYYNFGFSDPSYFYTGGKSTSENDVFFDGNNGVMVLSDKPVFINTYVTKLPYETCRNWDIHEWNHKKRHINEVCMDFDSERRTPKMYYADTSDIESGDCYVIAARFADGTVRLSEVRQK